MLNRCLLIIVAIAMCMHYGAMALAAPADFDKIITSLQEDEKLLRSIRIDATGWVEKSKDSEVWVTTPAMVSLTAWYNGLPGSLARLDVHRQVTEWVDGDAPYVENSYIAAHDGDAFKYIFLNTGNVGKTLPAPRANIWPKPTNELWLWDRCTGAALSTYLYRNADGQSLSQELMATAEKLRGRTELISVKSERYLECACARITIGIEDKYTSSWWLDPSRGYGLIGHEERGILDGKATVFTHESVTKLEAIAPGIWFPTAGWSAWRENDGTESRYRFEASQVVANDSPFDSSIFSPPIPSGYTVRDHVKNTTYIVATTQKLTSDLDKAIDEALATTRSSGPPGFSPPTASDQSTSRSGRLLWMGSILLILGAAAVLMFYWRRCRRPAR